MQKQTLSKIYIYAQKTKILNHVNDTLVILVKEEGGADVPLFETIKTNAGTQPKNELQQ